MVFAAFQQPTRGHLGPAGFDRYTPCDPTVFALMSMCATSVQAVTLFADSTQAVRTARQRKVFPFGEDFTHHTELACRRIFCAAGRHCCAAHRLCRAAGRARKRRLSPPSLVPSAAAKLRLRLLLRLVAAWRGRRLAIAVQGSSLRRPPQKGGAPPPAARPLFVESFISS